MSYENNCFKLFPYILIYEKNFKYYSNLEMEFLKHS